MTAKEAATRQVRYVIHWRHKGLDGVHTLVNAVNLLPHVEGLKQDGYDVQTVRILDFVPIRD